MKAVVYPQPNLIEIQEVPTPEPKAGQALVKIKSTTICGTDLKVLAGTFPGVKYPHIPGHEWAGEVVAVAPDVTEFAPGDRVAAEPHVGCGRCIPCMNGLYNLCEQYGAVEKGHAHIGFTVPGGLAQYCSVSVKALHKLADNLSYDQGAFCESVGVALYSIERATVEPGDSVVIYGPGAIGLVAVQIARARGASKVVLVGYQDGPRLALAKELGVDETVDLADLQVEKPAEYIRGLVGGKGADVTIEFAGSASAVQMALLTARRGGRVALCGNTAPGKILEIDCSVITRGHLNIFGSLANPKWICRRGLELVARGYVNVDPLLTHHFALEQFNEALEVFKSKSAGAYRVMLRPND
jgi:L-iditol 2-dehydrogenase